MVYIYNTNLKGDKRVRFALCEIYGIGKPLSYQISERLGVSERYKVSQLTPLQIQQLSQLIAQNFLIGTDKKRELRDNRNRLIQIGCYRGFRHNIGLPARGQRTHGNARTARRLLTNRKQ